MELRLALARDDIQRALSFIKDKHFEEMEEGEAITRLESLRSTWAIYKKNYGKVFLSYNDEDRKTLSDMYTTFQYAFFRASGALKGKISKQQPQLASEGVPSSDAQTVNVQLNMPVQQHDLRNTWGEFDGNYTKWPGFYDRFKAAIHDNEAVSPAFKFQYLKKSLVGKAARTLGEWQLTDENYQEAWLRLIQCFDKKYLTGREYMRAFMRLPELVSPVSSNDLQRMSNVTHETIRQLKSIGHPSEYYDFVFIHLLHERLDSETARQWELTRSSENPTIDEMTEFLDKQADALANSNPRSRQNFKVNLSNERASQARSDSQNRQKKEEIKLEVKKSACDACSGDHPIWTCPEFESLSLTAKKEFVKRRNLCENCLKRGHGPSNCYMAGCYRCPGTPKHNHLLCSRREVAVQAFLESTGAKRKQYSTDRE